MLVSVLTFLTAVLKNNKPGKIISLIKYYFTMYQTTNPFRINAIKAFTYVPTFSNLGSKLLHNLIVKCLSPLEQIGLAVKPF